MESCTTVNNVNKKRQHRTRKNSKKRMASTLSADEYEDTDDIAKKTARKSNALTFTSVMLKRELMEYVLIFCDNADERIYYEDTEHEWMSLIHEREEEWAKEYWNGLNEENIYEWIGMFEEDLRIRDFASNIYRKRREIEEQEQISDELEVKDMRSAHLELIAMLGEDQRLHGNILLQHDGWRETLVLKCEIIGLMFDRDKHRPLSTAITKNEAKYIDIIVK